MRIGTRPIRIRLGSIPGPSPRLCSSGDRIRRGVAVFFFFTLKKTNISGFVGNQLRVARVLLYFCKRRWFLIQTAGSVGPAANRVRVPRVYNSYRARLHAVNRRRSDGGLSYACMGVSDYLTCDLYNTRVVYLSRPVLFKRNRRDIIV